MSPDIAGASITLVKLDDGIESLLTDPAQAPRITGPASLHRQSLANGRMHGDQCVRRRYGCLFPVRVLRCR